MEKKCILKYNKIKGGKDIMKKKSLLVFLLMLIAIVTLSVGSVSASIQEGNWFSVSNDNIFDPEDGTDFSYSAERTFKLKTPNDFVGTDNTEVGINGGNYPWNKIPRMPVVKSLKLDVEGKQLNVTYEAEVR